MAACVNAHAVVTLTASHKDNVVKTSGIQSGRCYIWRYVSPPASAFNGGQITTPIVDCL